MRAFPKASSLLALILSLWGTLIFQSATAMDHGTSMSAANFDRSEALTISQAALGRSIDLVELRSTDGSLLRLEELRGQPLVISMIYTSCYHICPTTTKHLRRVVRAARAALGTSSFNVITVGFDVQRDSPQMMQFFADKQQISEAGWYFLSGDQENIDRLTQLLGFIYFPSPNGFDHLIQATLLNEEGVVIRQIYGMDFDMPLLVEPLKTLVLNTKTDSLFDNVANKVKLFCTVYDPAQNKYKFDYSLFIGTFIGFLCVGVLGFQLIKEWRITLSGNPDEG